MYADDMALGSPNREELQETLLELERWTEKNQLSINMQKTCQMTFRKGGRTSTKDTVMLHNEPITTVNRFKYLGVTLQTTGNTFRSHIQERTAEATKAIYRINNIAALSLKTATSLFETTISPIVTYGLELVWEKLTIQDLERIEKVKSRFLKCALRVGKYAPSRLAYELAKETFYIEDLRLNLPSTGASNKLLERRKAKRAEIDIDFYGTTAMTDRNWTKENQEQRHTITRLAVHGFHHKICRNKTYHTPNADCVCELCGQRCKQYHITECRERTKSISEYSKE